jgi:hypothetical protein
MTSNTSEWVPGFESWAKTNLPMIFWFRPELRFLPRRGFILDDEVLDDFIVGHPLSRRREGASPR